MLLDTLGNQELGILGPAIEALAKADLLFAQRLAVGRGGVLLVRGAVANVAVQNDEGGAARRFPENLKRVLDPVYIVGVAKPAAHSSHTQGNGRRCLP